MGWNFKKILEIFSRIENQAEVPKELRKYQPVIKVKGNDTKRIILKDKNGATISIRVVLAPPKEVSSKVVGYFKPKRRIRKGTVVRRKSKVIGVIKLLGLKEKIRAGEKGVIVEIRKEGPVEYGSFLYSYRPREKKKGKKKGGRYNVSN